MLGLLVLALTALRLAAVAWRPRRASNRRRPVAGQGETGSYTRRCTCCWWACRSSGWLVLSARAANDSLLAGLPPLVAENKDLANVLRKRTRPSATSATSSSACTPRQRCLYHHYVVRDDTLRRMLLR